MNHITTAELALWRRSGYEFTLLDVRRAEKRRIDADQIEGGAWLDPARWLDWKDTVSKERPAVVYCAHGHEISQAMTAALCALDVDARFLVGGIHAWRQAGLPVEKLKG